MASKEYGLSFPHPGWSEQDPQDWYRQSIAGLKELLAGCDKSQVAGISFGGQMHGLVALDDKDQVIRPAILWNDGRTTKQVAYLNEVIGRTNYLPTRQILLLLEIYGSKDPLDEGGEPENCSHRQDHAVKRLLAYRP